MDIQQIIQIPIGVIGGLGLFLLGMKQMSEGMQAVAGERLRRLISAVTENRLIAAGVGASITGLIQSSSVTTVMAVGMVNAGLMTLRQAVGVIMGTNIGTTITAWLIALRIADYGLPILGIAALVFLFAKNERVQYTAMVFLGLGMVFFGLELMKNGLKPLRDLPEFISLMSAFEPKGIGGLIKCVLAGSFLTAVIQSSSATVAITITLAATGVISFETAVALVLGENIGTTVTAFLASLGANTNAKRAAYAHIFFNVIGVSIMIPLFHQYVWLLKLVFPETLSMASRIAFSHTFFNSFVVALLLPFINPFTRLVEILVRSRLKKEKPHLTYLDVRMYDTPALAIQQSYREIIVMGEGIQKMMGWLRESLSDESNNKIRENKLFHREKVFDLMQKEIVEYIGKLMGGTLSHDVATNARNQLRMADENETISDYIITILKLNCRLRNNNLAFTSKGNEDMLRLHDVVCEYLNIVHHAVQERDREILSRAMSLGDAITHRVKDVRSDHLSRLENSETTPLVSLIYMDMLSAYRRIKDHAFNIAEVLAGEK